MSAKTKNTISLILNILICLSSFYALMSYFFKTGDGNMQVMGVQSFRYFTNLSNYFVAIVSLIMVIYRLKNIKDFENKYPHWLVSLKLCSTVSVSVTFLTCAVFLGPVFGMMWKEYLGFWAGYLILFKGNVFYLHLLSPFLAVISFVFFDRSDKLTKKDGILTILPTVLYGIVYFYMVIGLGVEKGGWPDFYNFTFGGKLFMVPVAAIVIPLVTYLVGCFEKNIHNKRN